MEPRKSEAVYRRAEVAARGEVHRIYESAGRIPGRVFRQHRPSDQRPSGRIARGRLRVSVRRTGDQARFRSLPATGDQLRACRALSAKRPFLRIGRQLRDLRLRPCQYRFAPERLFSRERRFARQRSCVGEGLYGPGDEYVPHVAESPFGRHVLARETGRTGLCGLRGLPEAQGGREGPSGDLRGRRGRVEH